jgi:hypothetical protein
MTVSGDPPSRLRARDFQPRVRFGPTFSCSRLDAAGSVADAQLSDQREQQANRGIATITQPTRGPFAPQSQARGDTRSAQALTGNKRGLEQHENGFQSPDQLGTSAGAGSSVSCVRAAQPVPALVPRYRPVPHSFEYPGNPSRRISQGATASLRLSQLTETHDFVYRPAQPAHHRLRAVRGGWLVA